MNRSRSARYRTPGRTLRQDQAAELLELIDRITRTAPHADHLERAAR